MTHNELIPISVVIRTFNSSSTLVRLLSRLDLKACDEVIIVDSGSKDKTKVVAKRFGAIFDLAPPPFNYSKSLNIGFKKAKNDIVLVLSSHVIPMVPDLLNRYREEFIRIPKDLAVIYGPGGITGKDDLGITSSSLTIADRDSGSWIFPVVGNANSIYRKKVWETIPFDESIRTDEDKSWARAALASGYRIGYLPTALVMNKSNYSLAYMFRKGESDARAIKSEGAAPMRLRHLLGAEKKMFLKLYRGEIDFGNWIRYSFHILGTYSGSRKPKDNTPHRILTSRP